jgi:hypothetical protein
LSFIGSGYGIVLTIGSIAGVIAWIYAVVVIRGIFQQMQTIGREIQAQGSPPTPEQATQMQALVARLGQVGQVAVVFLVVALLGMATARYIPLIIG